jgi:hypothetical protein
VDDPADVDILPFPPADNFAALALETTVERMDERIVQFEHAGEQKLQCLEAPERGERFDTARGLVGGTDIHTKPAGPAFPYFSNQEPLFIFPV